MSDDEVVQWLNDDEREAVDGYSHPKPLDWARTIAKLRKALLVHEWGSHVGDVFDVETGEHRGGIYVCPECGACDDARKNPRREHKPDCIFSTMPRPK